MINLFLECVEKCELLKYVHKRLNKRTDEFETVEIGIIILPKEFLDNIRHGYSDVCLPSPSYTKRLCSGPCSWIMPICLVTVLNLYTADQ